MKILDRYIIRTFLKPFFYCMVMFLFLYCLIDILNNLDEIIKANTKIYIVFYYYLKFIPLVLTHITPMAMLLATLYSLGMLNKHNEIIAIISSGISIWRLAMIFLGTALLVSLIMVYLNARIVPYSYAESIQIKEQYFKKAQAPNQNKVITNVSLYGMDNRIYFMRSYDTAREEMNDVTILEHDSLNNLTKKTIALRGIWIDNKWTLYDVTEAFYLNDEIMGQAVTTQEKSFNYAEKPSDFEKSDIQPMFMTYKQHRRYIRWLYRTGRAPTKELTELYSKIAICFANLIAVFIALPFSLITKQRQGMLLGIGISIFIGFGYWGVNAVAVAFGKSGLLIPFLGAWLANIFFAFLSTILLRKTSL